HRLRGGRFARRIRSCALQFPRPSRTSSPPCRSVAFALHGPRRVLLHAPPRPCDLLPRPIIPNDATLHPGGKNSRRKTFACIPVTTRTPALAASLHRLRTAGFAVARGEKTPRALPLLRLRLPRDARGNRHSWQGDLPRRRRDGVQAHPLPE